MVVAPHTVVVSVTTMVVAGKVYTPGVAHVSTAGVGTVAGLVVVGTATGLELVDTTTGLELVDTTTGLEVVDSTAGGEGVAEATEVVLAKATGGGLCTWEC